MITYDLSTKGRPESYRRIRATKLDKVEEVTKEEYEATMDRNAYRSQLEEWRTNDAYQVLSRAAEDLLGATERGRRRDIVPEPTRSPAPRTFGMKLMSNTERRLRRLAGQIRQLHHGSNMGDFRSRRKITANLDWACLRYDHVMPSDITDLRILKYAEDLADDIANHDTTHRIEAHVEKMSSDLAAAQRWINNAEDVDAWQDGEKVHPQDRVVELSNEWQKWGEVEPVQVRYGSSLAT